MASAEVLFPSPRVNMLDSVALTSVDNVALPSLCAPPRGLRRPSGTAESESDSPPSKRSKKARRRRKKKPRQRASANGLRTKPVAPLNTTQFLMAEHDQLQDTDIVAARPRRHRDSSLSVDSEDQAYDEFYSSPEDEEEFLTREFWTAYEDVHAERLDTMTKAQLVQEYLALEEKVDLLERQLRAVRARHRQRQQEQDAAEGEDEDEEDVGPGEVLVDEETAEKISIFQSEISSLETENRRLREENFKLRRCSSARSSSSSSSSGDSSSDSSSSSSSDSSSDSEMEDDERPKATTCLSPSRGAPEAAAPDTSVRPAAADTCAGEARLPPPEALPDGGEAALPTQPSSFTTPPASPALEDDHKTKGEVSASRSAEGGGVEAEVSSTTAT
ncbi:uncharacterized protein LOC134787033 [Penaeus indicus]|uniref:uncharacterized protein LOC134787033 n=1 Tax=Penaeus indicus TaxID=29960 RepID=UPI00300C93BD